MSLSQSQPSVELGNGHEVDSLSACMHAALSQWGRKVAYDCVAGLSGAAFSPALNHAQTCAAWWMEARNDSRMEFVGHALGFSVAPSPDEPDDAADFARRASAAMDQGAVVLCRAWPCWSIVSAWHDDPARCRLLAPEGLEQHCEARGDASFVILRPAEPALTRCEALREAVRFGADLASGRAAHHNCEYGGRLYDAWVGRLDEECFCPDCGENGWRCAERTASRVRAGQMSAAHFLSRAQAFLPVLAEDSRVGEAAGLYGIMADTLEPYTWGSGLNLTWDVPDLHKQYVQDVWNVRALHARAAEHLSQAACHL